MTINFGAINLMAGNYQILQNDKSENVDIR